jgi:uncharacterized DUF497 family protein
MVFDWSEEKNNQLKRERGITFERVVIAIEDDCILDILEHPNKTKYGKQILLLVEIDAYVYVVPTVREEDKWFFKTIFPSRKYTDLYLPEKRRMR